MPKHIGKEMARTKKQTIRRQPALSRLPGRSLGKKTGGRRSRFLSVNFSNSSKLVFSFRQFRTSRSKRSRRYPQIVITVPLLATREIAITKLRTQRRQPGSIGRYLKPTAAIPLFLGVGGVIYFGSHLKQPAKVNIPTTKGHVLAAQSIAAKTMPASTPVRLRIDKIGIAAPVIGLGLKADGSLDTPPGPEVVGWYSGSPAPGQLGPSVIDGHVDWINNIAVFWRLRELSPGDTFAVDRADGSTANFKVTGIQEFPQDSFPTDEVYGKINYAGIRLITCGGQFNTSTGHYSHNIIVFGRLL
jgi:sortase (surface protein transpeptidase)